MQYVKALNNKVTDSVRPDLFNHAASLGFGDIHFKIEKKTGLYAIVAIHNTRLGPALGGCRCLPYPSTEAALIDVLNLAHAMSYKAAMAGLPLGGGKSVIIRPNHIEDRVALFEAYGRFVDELGGRFISSVDSGTDTADMDAAAHYSNFIRSTSDRGDPSPITALGIRRGIQAAVKHKLGRAQLEGIHVAIQGAGHVGYHLAKELHYLGAKLTMCDNKQAAMERCAAEFNADLVAPTDIFKVKADVFSPCALGAVINDNTLPQLDVAIIAGATNNPLADVTHAQDLHQRGILYAPDYIINAGGLMQVWIQDAIQLHNKVFSIYDTLINIFEQADNKNASPLTVVDRMAEEILYGSEPG